MIRFIYGSIFFVIVATPFSSKAKDVVASYTLKQAVEHALQANPSIESKLLIIEKAKMDVGVAQSYFLPTVSFVENRNKLTNSGDVGTSEDYSNISKTSGVRVSLSLFSGFSHLNNLHKSMLTVDMEKEKHRQARLELISNIHLQFLQLLKAREDMRTVQDSKKRITTQLKAAQAFVKVGMAPYLNVLQNEVEMSKVTQLEIRTANTIRNAEVTLNKYLGYEPNIKISYNGKLEDYNNVIGYTEEEAIHKSLYSRPDLIMAQKTVAVAIKQSHITAGKYLPNVSLSYDNMYNNKNYRDMKGDYARSYWNLGLNISWEFFSGGGTTYAYFGDKKIISSLRKDYENTMANARADVIRSLLDTTAARDLITASRKGVDAASESYAMANKRYMTNTGTITELLDAQARLTEAEAGYSQALTEYHGARSRFFYHIGQENIGLE